ncbi:ATP-binding cassette domain-containing protein [Paenibacillus doosanensis]|uniref:ABC transporter ATP-binding protein n=1 Tax=Paenibacillus doosanensis TaxID=1229154 RepID=UPI00218023E8|nr:ATP-binding cassette domain-containing protein [Paenibacillus doosanensis]MCS7460390.1 ATP-binding cassette domain-containing protein [Paenibacillus doosanensis]
MNSNLLLQTRNLTKSFGGRKMIDSLNLHVMKGDIYGFLGRNGQGKTTAIRLVTGLIFPDSGEVMIDGHPLRSDFKKAISNVGAIVESPSFYGYLSGYDNLKLMANLIPGIKKDRIDEVLDMVRLSRRAKDKVKTYSLGMKQRLGIANALLGSPKLIILDEPTNGLDPQGIKEIKEMIVQLASERNITFFISSHLLQEVEQICNRIGIIDKGKLLCEATMDELTQTANSKSLEDIYFDLTGKGGDLA